MPHVPDTVPGKRVTGAGARTEGREASRQTSEVGAVCRKAARTVLCGGRPVMGVPTAIGTKAVDFRSIQENPQHLSVTEKVPMTTSDAQPPGQSAGARRGSIL